MGTKTPPVQKPEQKKAEQVQQPKTSPLPQAKTEKGPAESLKDGVAPNLPKAGQSTCPLCKLELNFGSKDPPNYNKCTECKSTVCNQCGFNPMPNVSEVIIRNFFLTSIPATVCEGIPQPKLNKNIQSIPIDSL